MPHIHEKIDFTSEVFIVHKDRVLLRKHDKYKTWLGVGGHIELDEDPVTTAIRECKEEVGLTVRILSAAETHTWPEGRKELALPIALNMHPINAAHTHISFMYAATTDSDVVVPENADDEWLWLTKDELDTREDINPDIRHYALTALKLAS